MLTVRMILCIVTKDQPRSQDCKNRGELYVLWGGGGTSRNIFKSKLILFESYYSTHTGENLQLGGSVDIIRMPILFVPGSKYHSVLMHNCPRVY